MERGREVRYGELEGAKLCVRGRSGARRRTGASTTPAKGPMGKFSRACRTAGDEHAVWPSGRHDVELCVQEMDGFLERVT